MGGRRGGGVGQGSGQGGEMRAGGHQRDWSIGLIWLVTRGGWGGGVGGWAREAGKGGRWGGGGHQRAVWEQQEKT